MTQVCKPLLSPSRLSAISRFREMSRAFSSVSDDIFDVVVVGGGLVGSALAAALSSDSWTKGLKVAIIDRQGALQESTALPDIPGLRVSTITPSSVQLFQQIASWQDVAPPRSAPFSSMQVWDWGGNGFVRYNAADAGEAQIGFVAENLVLQLAILRHLARPGRAPVFQKPGRVASLALPPYSPSQGKGGAMPLAALALEDGRILHAKLVVGADGGKSQVRQLADLRTVGWPYHQRGLVATVRTEPENTVAHQRFLDTGPIALLPVRGGYSNIVWSTTPQRAEQISEAGSREFAAAANHAFAGGSSPSSRRFGPGFEPPPHIIESVGPKPQSFPLVLMHAGRYVRPRLALIGDAAHSVHPLAGQGVNLGFQDVKALTSCLAHAVECGRDLGEVALLEEMYERPRQRANLAMMSGLDSLSRIYKPQEGLLAGVRSLGLGLINSSSAAKQQIMKYAMGL